MTDRSKRNITPGKSLCDTCLWEKQKEVKEGYLPRRCDWYEVCIYEPMEDAR